MYGPSWAYSAPGLRTRAARAAKGIRFMMAAVSCLTARPPAQASLHASTLVVNRVPVGTVGPVVSQVMHVPCPKSTGRASWPYPARRPGTSPGPLVLLIGPRPGSGSAKLAEKTESASPLAAWHFHAPAPPPHSHANPVTCPIREGEAPAESRSLRSGFKRWPDP